LFSDWTEENEHQFKRGTVKGAVEIDFQINISHLTSLYKM